MAARKPSQTKTTSPKKNSRKTPEVTERTRIRKVLRWSLFFILKMTLLTVFVISLYSIYLDSKVRSKFEGQRWQVPVQVFGKLESYELGGQLNLTDLKHLSLIHI